MIIYKKYILEVKIISLEVLFKNILSQIKKNIYLSQPSYHCHKIFGAFFMDWPQLPQPFTNLFHQLWKDEMLSRPRIHPVVLKLGLP